MKRLFAGAALILASAAAWALQPYVASDTKVAAGDLKAAMTAVEQKLTGAGFQVVGRHTPKGLKNGSLIVTDTGLTDAVKSIGGSAIVYAPIRVGVKPDGTVSYVNAEYWGRAFLRKNYGKAEPAVKAVSGKLETALGKGQPFGGDIKVDDLATYRYMFGMERFDDRAELNDLRSFDEAVKTVRDNLAKGVGNLAKVYEIVMPDKKLALFGVAMNDAEHGEGWWVNIIGTDNIAALPWEVFVVDGKVYALHGRYRTALAWPSLGMGQFMKIGKHPDVTLQWMEAVAGVK